MSNKEKFIYYSMLKYQPENLEILREKFDLVTLKSPKFDTDQLLSDAKVILAPLGYYFGKEKIDKCSSLKIIGSNTTGHPHIDVEYASSKGIKVITLKNDHNFLDSITPTAELAFGLIISLTRNIFPASNTVSQGLWDRRLNPGSKMLSNMSIGIVGLGRLGFKVAQMAKTFEMQVYYYDPFVDKKYPGIQKISTLSQLVSKVDVVSVHVPHEKETENMFNNEIFSKFKNDSFFINTSRGELVDHNALLSFLKNKKLRGAAIDVIENEFSENFSSSLRENSLWKYSQENNNLIITPHIGGSTKDAWLATEGRVIDRIIDFLDLTKTKNHKIIEKNDFSNGALAFIPARGGSKSITLKNLAKLNGLPLLAYPINAAKKSKNIKSIVVSTDHDEIKSFSLLNDIDVDDRPEALSGNDISTVEVMIDYVKRLELNIKNLPECIVLLEPTSPFIDPNDIDFCIDLLNKNKEFDSVQTTTKVSPNSHAFNQRYLNEDGSHFLYEKERKLAFNKQKKPQLYIHGNLRVTRTSSLLKYKSIFGRISHAVEISKVKSFDVDGPEDLQIAESLIKRFLNN